MAPKVYLGNICTFYICFLLFIGIFQHQNFQLSISRSIIVVGCAILPSLIKLFCSSCQKLPERFALYFGFYRDTQKFGTLLLRAISLFLALSINVGVHGMVTSFKSTFVEWLENRIFADYYINIANEIKLNEIQAIVKKYSGEVSNNKE